MKASTLVVTAASLALLACTSDPVTDDSRPPAEVGGRFAIGGFSFGGPEQAYGFEGQLSPEELRLRERARRFEMTVWQGALIGGVAGGLIGALAGGDAEDAAGGAMVGGTLGGIAGVYVASKQEQYADTEDQLEAMTEDVRASIREAEALIASARAVLAEDRRRLAAVEAQYRRGEATDRALQQERARVWGNRRVIEQASVDAGDRYRVFDLAAERLQRQEPAARTRDFDLALQEYRRNIDTLDEITAGLGRA